MINSGKLNNFQITKYKHFILIAINNDQYCRWEITFLIYVLIYFI